MNNSCITIIANTTTLKRGVLFYNPIIKDKDSLEFEDNSIGVKSYYMSGENYIHVELSKRIVNLSIDETDKEFLSNYHKNELDKVNKFFKNILKEDLWITELGEVTTKGLIDSAFNPYYTKLFIYLINTNFNMKFVSKESVNNFILNNINLSKYKLTEIDGYGQNYIIPFKELNRV